MKCKVPTCTYDTEEDIDKTSSTGEHLQLLGFHMEDVHPKPDQDWDFFTFSWGQYKSMVNITERETENLAVGLGPEVVALVFHRLGKETYESLTEEDLLREARQLVVKSRNKLVYRLKLGTMVQGGDESITSFETRLKPVARTGRFQVECTTCKKMTDYTDLMVLDNLIRGLADEEIKRKVLATPET